VPEGRCRDCRHWDRGHADFNPFPEPGQPDYREHGRCALAATEGRQVHPESLAAAYGQEGNAWLLTAPSFGCCQWAPKLVLPTRTSDPIRVGAACHVDAADRPYVEANLPRLDRRLREELLGDLWLVLEDFTLEVNPALAVTVETGAGAVVLNGHAAPPLPPGFRPSLLSALLRAVRELLAEPRSVQP